MSSKYIPPNLRGRVSEVGDRSPAAEGVVEVEEEVGVGSSSSSNHSSGGGVAVSSYSSRRPPLREDQVESSSVPTRSELGSRSRLSDRENEEKGHFYRDGGEATEAAGTTGGLGGSGIREEGESGGGFVGGSLGPSVPQPTQQPPPQANNRWHGGGFRRHLEGGDKEEYNSSLNRSSSSGGGTGGGSGRRPFFSSLSAGGGPKLRVVEIDSLVLIKVMKHCRDNYPTPVNGQLLGMDTGDQLEVTNCFPLPQKKDIYQSVQKEKMEKEVDERVEDEFEKYQDKMAELMHDVHVDCFTVGWYQTLSFGDLKNKDNIDSLVLYQELVDKAIMLGFDPLLNAMGRMAFKAFRVSDEFLAKYHDAEEQVSKYNKLRGKDILVEVPIVIRNPLLVEAYLQEWVVKDVQQSLAEFDALEVDQNNYLEKNLNFLSDCLEDLSLEQEKLIKYQREHLKQQQLQKQIVERRRLENDQRRLRGEPLLPMDFDGPAFRRLDPPSQVTTLLMSNQAAIQCREINDIASENLGKLYLLNRSLAKTTLK